MQIEFENTEELCKPIVIIWGDLNTNSELIKSY